MKNEYTVIFRNGLKMGKVPAENANQAKILAQAEMIAQGHPYAVKKVKKHRSEK